MTTPSGIRGNDGYVVLDPKRMEQLRLNKGVSRRGFAELADASPTTAYRFFEGKRIQIQIARRLFDNLGIQDFRPYLVSNDRAKGGALDSDGSALTEWRIENVMSKPVTLSNGLEFQVCKLTHEVLPNTHGRGKCYDLRQLNSRDDLRAKEQLLRHPSVCRMLEQHPRFPVNERVLYSEDKVRFWVIDRWFDGVTLEEKLRYGPLTGNLLAKVMWQLLDGISALHGHRIIRRELSPKYVVLTEPNADVLFTELELAKLLEGGISVSDTWDADPYRAPEIENAEISDSVDLYSWAQIFTCAATGVCPPSPADPRLLEGASLPKSVLTVTQRCLSLSYKFRPTLHEVQKVIREWHQ